MTVAGSGTSSSGTTWFTLRRQTITIPTRPGQRPKYSGPWRLRDRQWERPCVVKVPEMTSEGGGFTTASVVVLGPKLPDHIEGES